MQFFRMRLILALVRGITLVSVASTYFEVLAHKHILRRELERRTAWLSKSLQSEMEKPVASGQTAEIAAAAARLRSQSEALGLAVYDIQGELVTEAGPAGVFGALPRGPWTKPSSRVSTRPFLGARTIDSGLRRRFRCMSTGAWRERW